MPEVGKTDFSMGTKERRLGDEERTDRERNASRDKSGSQVLDEFFPHGPEFRRRLLVRSE